MTPGPVPLVGPDEVARCRVAVAREFHGLCHGPEHTAGPTGGGRSGSAPGHTGRMRATDRPTPLAGRTVADHRRAPQRGPGPAVHGPGRDGGPRPDDAHGRADRRRRAPVPHRRTHRLSAGVDGRDHRVRDAAVVRGRRRLGRRATTSSLRSAVAGSWPEDPKARSACRQRGLDVVWSAPDESMPEVLAWLGEQPGVGGPTVAVQLFDPEDHPSTDVLRTHRRRRGGGPDLPVARAGRPRAGRGPRPGDRRPHGRCRDLHEPAGDPVPRRCRRTTRDAAAAWSAAFNDGSVLPVCVGPVCAEAAVDVGITTSVWPDPYRLVPMVTLATDLLGA